MRQGTVWLLTWTGHEPHRNLVGRGRPWVRVYGAEEKGRVTGGRDGHGGPRWRVIRRTRVREVGLRTTVRGLLVTHTTGAVALYRTEGRDDTGLCRLPVLDLPVLPVLDLPTPVYLGVPGHEIQ